MTNNVIVDERGSTRKRKSTRNDPDWIQVNPCETLVRASGLSDRSAKNAMTDATNESPISAVAEPAGLGLTDALAEQQQHDGPGGRERGDRSTRGREGSGRSSSAQPFIKSTSSAFTDCLRRKMAMMIASPTATSAAATTSVKNTITCPLMSSNAFA